MSLQVNLTGTDIKKAYQDVLNQQEIDWALFTYEKGSNDLKLQSTGDGGLEELQDEFSDGRLEFLVSTYYIVAYILYYSMYFRIQYAFVRVTDPNVRGFTLVEYSGAKFSP